MSTFSDRTVLVSVTLHGWTARKRDEAVTDEIHRTHNAARDSGAYTKLLVEAKSLEPIKAADSAIRAYHYAQTLPWSDSSERILPIANFDAYMGGLSRLLDNRETAVAAFIAEYAGLVERARFRLNGIFNAADYPTPDELRGRFRADVKHWPFPDVGDFRVDLGEQQLACLRSGLAERTAAAQQEAVRDCWRRLHEHINRMHERLSVPIGEKGARFSETLVTGLQELVDLLPRLNVTGDPELDRLTDEARRRLVVPPDMLRGNAHTRAATAANARDMLSRMEQYAAALNPNEAA